MNDYTWGTSVPHSDNTETMSDYLNNHLPENWKVLIHDGSYAEVQDESGSRWEVHASGDGDSFNHRVRFELISKPFYKEWRLGGRVRFIQDGSSIEVRNHGKCIGWADCIDDKTAEMFKNDPSSVKAIIRRKHYDLMIVPVEFTEPDIQALDDAFNKECAMRHFGVTEEEFNSPEFQRMYNRSQRDTRELRS